MFVYQLYKYFQIDISKFNKNVKQNKTKKNIPNETKTVTGFVTKYWHCSPLTMTIRTQ